MQNPGNEIVWKYVFWYVSSQMIVETQQSFN